MKTLATLIAAIGVSISLAGTAFATAPEAQLEFAPSKEMGIAPAACYYDYTWIGNYYMRRLICF